MALNVEQLVKVAGLMDSDQEHEALAALRMARKLLKKEGQTLGAIIEAGMSSISSPKVENPFFDAFGIKPTAQPAASKPAAPQARRKSTIFVDVDDLPGGYFNATLKIQEARETRDHEPMLVIDVSHDSVDTFKRYPTMYAFGKQAQAISLAIADRGPAISATLKVRPPQRFGHLPTITSVQC